MSVNPNQFVLYYSLPNRRLAVVRNLKGKVCEYNMESVAIDCAQYISMYRSYHLDYPIVIKEGFSFDNTTDGIKRTDDDTESDEVYGYPAGKQPRGLYTL